MVAPAWLSTNAKKPSTPNPPLLNKAEQVGKPGKNRRRRFLPGFPTCSALSRSGGAIDWPQLLPIAHTLYIVNDFVAAMALPFDLWRLRIFTGLFSPSLKYDEAASRLYSMDGSWMRNAERVS